MDALEEFTTILAKGVKDGNIPIEVANMLMTGAFSTTTGLVKIAAPFKYVSKVFKGGVREEHNPPASVIGGTLMWAVQNNAVKDIFPEIRKNYYQTQLSNDVDTLLNKNYKSTAPFPILFNPAFRLSASGVDLNTIINPVTGKTMAEEQNVAVPVNTKMTPELLKAQTDLMLDQLKDETLEAKDVQKEIDAMVKVNESVLQASQVNRDSFNFLTENMTVKEQLDMMKTYDKALDVARDLNAPEKGISVFDFDQTLADTKEKIIVTMLGESVVYNASPKTFDQLGKRTGLIFLATDIKEAQEYAKSNRGKVREISINDSSLATEDQVLDAMKNLNIDTSEGLLYEMIDSRFKDFYIGDANLNKLKKALKQRGFGGFKYNDGSQLSSKGTESVAIIEKSIIKQPTKINAAEFAEQAAELEQQGATFDFSEFTKVVDGKKGPMFDLAMRRQDKFTSKDIFILTARPQEAAVAISAFLKGMGLNIPVDNIVGLADGRPEAKANWIVGKAAEGYNNFYFADDAYKNVKVVQDVLNVIDVKGKVQQAKLQFSKGVDKQFNTILQEKTGVKQEAKFSDAAAKSRGMKSLPWYKRWFIPPSAEDFVGLLYHFTPKGKKGEQAMEFFKKTLIDPFARGFKNINAAKQVLANDFDALQKAYPNIKKLYNKDTGYNNFTNEQAIRVYLWDKNGIEIPGISKKRFKSINKNSRR